MRRWESYRELVIKKRKQIKHIIRYCGFWIATTRLQTETLVCVWNGAPCWCLSHWLERLQEVMRTVFLCCRRCVICVPNTAALWMWRWTVPSLWTSLKSWRKWGSSTSLWWRKTSLSWRNGSRRRWDHSLKKTRRAHFILEFDEYFLLKVESFNTQITTRTEEVKTHHSQLSELNRTYQSLEIDRESSLSQVDIELNLLIYVSILKWFTCIK